MTPEEREEMRRHFGLLTEDVQSQLRMVAEGNAMTAESLQRLNDKVDAFRADFDGSRLDTARNFATVRAEIGALRGEADAFRAETAHSFAAVHAEIGAVRGEADTFHTETARSFAELRADLRSSRKDVDRRVKAVEARHASRR
jgi:hypothetical protein